MLQDYNIEVSEYWKYTVKYRNDESEAMHLAKRCIIPGEEYKHDPEQTNE